MEKSKSIISWGQLFLIVGTMCLFLFALTQRVTFEKQPEIEIVPVQGFVMSGGTITGYDGDETTLVIPGTYSLGPTTNMSGSITFNNRDEAWDFLQEHYAVGTEGDYDVEVIGENLCDGIIVINDPMKYEVGQVVNIK